MKQMPGEYNLEPTNLPRGCSDNRIVACYVCMNNVEPFSFQPHFQSYRGEEVGGVQERQFDLWLQGAIRASGNYHVVTRLSK